VSATLYDFLPRLEAPTADHLLDRFLDFARTRGIELYPAQEEAILELYSGKNVILNTPTGSGKSLVASALHKATNRFTPAPLRPWSTRSGFLSAGNSAQTMSA